MPKAATALLFLLGGAHLLVDASSNFVMMHLLRPATPAAVVGLLIAYNFAAFALQPVAGLLAMRLGRPRAVMCLGILLVASAMLVPEGLPWGALAVTGLGNALFHVGGGTLASLATEGRASGPGLFIAPGAVGVALGTLAGRGAPEALWPLFVGLLVVAVAGGRIPAREHETPAAAGRAIESRVPRGPRTVLVLLLLAIAMRSFLGGRVMGSLGALEGWALPLAGAAFAGKALGGVVADRVGWMRTAVVSLVVSSVLLAVAALGTWVAALAVAFFQAVTAITLCALYRVLPGRMPLAFGLASLAIFVGGLPLLARVNLWALGGVPLDAILALASAAAIWRALSRLERGT